MPGALTVQAALWLACFFPEAYCGCWFHKCTVIWQHLSKGQAEVCMFVLSHLLISMWQIYFKMLGLSNISCCSTKNDIKFLHKQCYKFAGWKVLRYCCVQIADNSYSKIFPYLWYLQNHGRNIPQANSCILFIVSPFSLHPDRALSLALVPHTYVQLLLQSGMLLDFILMITDQELSQPLSPTQNQFINMVFVEVLESPMA